MLNPIQAIKTFWRHKFDFTGRASRSEYWWTFLFTAIFVFGFIFLENWIWPFGVSGNLGEGYVDHGWDGVLNDFDAYPLTNVVQIILFFPLLFQSMRRLHDTARHGWLAVTVAVLDIPMAYIPVELISRFILKFTGGFPGWSALSNEPFSGADYVALIFFVLLIILSIWQFILNVLPSHRGPNRYGPNPLGQGNVDVFA